MKKQQLFFCLARANGVVRPDTMPFQHTFLSKLSNKKDISLY
jgi:hypothetical protein